VFDDVALTVIEPTRVDVFAFDPEAAELGPDPGEFALLRSGDTEVELPVQIHWGGIASNGVDYVWLTNVAVFAPGEFQLTLPVTPFLDHRIEGDETAVLTVVSNLAYSTGNEEATVVIRDSPYGQWSVAQFTLEELTEPDSSGEGADFDRDGVVNFVEYAFNRDPKTVETSALIRTELIADEDTGTMHVVITYTRRLEATDTGYAVVVSSDLATWQADAAAVEEVSAVDDQNGLTETVTARVLAPFPGLSPQFVTVRVWLRATGP
jgi:hypothetical protein